MSEQIYTIAEVAKRYNVHRKTIERWITNKKLNAVRATKYYIIRQSDIEAFEREYSTKPDATQNA